MSKINHNRPQFRKNLDLTPYSYNSIEKAIPTQHMDHSLYAVATVAPHYGKLVCKTCNNKFVKWLTAGNFKDFPRS